eukprot:407408-Pyramimonas_sp.AAC.1
MVTATGAFNGAPDEAADSCTGWRGRVWSQPLGPSVELPRATTRRTGWRGAHVVIATGAFGGASYGARKHNFGWRETLVGIGTRAFGGARSGATTPRSAALSGAARL